MKEITQNTNECAIDQLDGKDLVEGEKLRVQWPDGILTLETVHIMESRGLADFITRRAYLTVRYHRASANIALGQNGFKAERYG